LTTMLSMYASMMCPLSSPKTCHMHRWNVAPTFLSQKNIVLLCAEPSDE
jgi:hypothetical protein